MRAKPGTDWTTAGLFLTAMALYFLGAWSGYRQANYDRTNHTFIGVRK